MFGGLRYLFGNSVEYLWYWGFCTLRYLSCKGVDGGDVAGVEFSDEEERFSDGKVASVQYEPSDSPSLSKKNIDK